MNGTYLLISALLIVVCVAAGYWIYKRRDLYI
jgi:ABC-type transport system involved in multi-copper enzyme maturation permease subunit